MRKIIMVASVIALLGLGVMAQADVTGNPLADGWVSGGNSLSNGVYVRGSANYGFETYSALLTVSAGSALAINDGANSWVAGDTVMGVGGRFADITASEAGWSAFTGNSVNSLIHANGDVKLQAKFGADNNTFAASTIAPSAGNGLGSMGTNGGVGAVQVRTTAYFAATDWAAGSGALQLLNKSSHIEKNGSAAPDSDVARLMWQWNSATSRVDSWQILLNTSLLERLGSTSVLGNSAIMTVQQRDGAYTDALVSMPAMAPVPEPGSILAALSILGPAGILFRRRKLA